MKEAKTRRRTTRGGGMALAGAPLDYSLRPGVQGVYGNFPSYQTQGLDRYYDSAVSADCGKPNGFPTDGSGASQAAGSLRQAGGSRKRRRQAGGLLGFDGLRAFAGASPVGWGAAPSYGYMSQQSAMGQSIPSGATTVNNTLMPTTMTGVIQSQTIPVPNVQTITSSLQPYSSSTGTTLK